MMHIKYSGRVFSAGLICYLTVNTNPAAGTIFMYAFLIYKFHLIENKQETKITLVFVGMISKKLIT